MPCEVKPAPSRTFVHGGVVVTISGPALRTTQRVDGPSAQETGRSLRLARTILSAQHRDSQRTPFSRTDGLRILNAILQRPTRLREVD